jgi:hypothetical protein
MTSGRCNRGETIVASKLCVVEHLRLEFLRLVTDSSLENLELGSETKPDFSLQSSYGLSRNLPDELEGENQLPVQARKVNRTKYDLTKETVCSGCSDDASITK